MVEQTNQPTIEIDTAEADREGKGKPTRTNKPKMAKNNIQRSRFVVDGMRPESERRAVDEMEQRHRSSSTCAHRDKTHGHSVSLLSLVNAQRRETMKQGNPKMPSSVLKSRVRLFNGNPKLPNLRYVHTE